jgi:mannose-1-phosphate guanylyltransferase
MSETKQHTFVLIVCGGGGSRLWPKSTPQNPKQFLNLFGSENLFQKTVGRALRIAPHERIFIVTGANYVSDILAADPQINPGNILVEPDKKHTAIAIALGAAIIETIDPEAIIVNLWSDHLIETKEQFTSDINQAVQVANEKKSLLALGIKPTFPHTGFGYLEAGEAIGPNLFYVKKFREKPDQVTAKQFVEAGNFYWNLGTYIWPVKIFFSELERLSPDLYRQARAIQDHWGKGNYWWQISNTYREVNPISIDVAVSEKSQQMLLFPASFSWRDVGDWQAVWENEAKSKTDNVLLEREKQNLLLDVDSQGCLIAPDDKLIATVGLTDLVIVDTPQGLLISDKNQSQKVKDVVEKLDQ